MFDTVKAGIIFVLAAPFLLLGLLGMGLLWLAFPNDGVECYNYPKYR